VLWQAVVESSKRPFAKARQWSTEQQSKAMEPEGMAESSQVQVKQAVYYGCNVMVLAIARRTDFQESD
jgi:hypothetical protein